MDICYYASLICCETMSTHTTTTRFGIIDMATLPVLCKVHLVFGKVVIGVCVSQLLFSCLVTGVRW